MIRFIPKHTKRDDPLEEATWGYLVIEFNGINLSQHLEPDSGYDYAEWFAETLPYVLSEPYQDDEEWAVDHVLEGISFYMKDNLNIEVIGRDGRKIIVPKSEYIKSVTNFVDFVLKKISFVSPPPPLPAIWEGAKCKLKKG
jgi:hypothetical protein